jgi:hypothetical protein
MVSFIVLTYLGFSTGEEAGRINVWQFLHAGVGRIPRVRDHHDQNGGEDIRHWMDKSPRAPVLLERGEAEVVRGCPVDVHLCGRNLQADMLEMWNDCINQVSSFGG